MKKKNRALTLHSPKSVKAWLPGAYELQISSFRFSTKRKNVKVEDVQSSDSNSLLSEIGIKSQI